MQACARCLLSSILTINKCRKEIVKFRFPPRRGPPRASAASRVSLGLALGLGDGVASRRSSRT